MSKKIFICFVFGMLNYPLKAQKNIPNILIYTAKKTLKSGVYRYYSKMFDLKSGKLVAYMNSEKELIEREDGIAYSLYVDVLKCLHKQQGFGTKMLNFAENLSRNLGCNGNIHLIASSEFSPKKNPHIFYRKYGMNTGNYEYDQKMDKYIRKNKKATSEDFPNIEMYYPPLKSEINPDELPYCEKESFLKSLFKKFLKL